MKLTLNQLRSIIKEELMKENMGVSGLKVGDQVRLVNDDPPSVVASETERWGSKYGMRGWSFDNGPKVTDNVWGFNEIGTVLAIEDVMGNGELKVQVERPNGMIDWFFLDQVEPA
jgi:hypothetical protein